MDLTTNPHDDSRADRGGNNPYAAWSTPRVGGVFGSSHY
jgi:hypothetical protein